jgi:predicted Zn-dependent protease
LAVVGELRERFPDSIDVEVLSGDAALLAGDPATALAAYRRAAAVRRDFALVERMVAAQRMLGREVAAAATLSAYLAQNPRSVPGSLMLGRMLARQGDERRASLLFAYARELGGSAKRPQRDEGRVAATLARLLAAAGG